jgi:hypothetical protein
VKSEDLKSNVGDFGMLGAQAVRALFYHHEEGREHEGKCSCSKGPNSRLPVKPEAW